MSDIRADSFDAGWHRLYTLGAMAAILALAGTLLDIVLTSMPGWQTSTVPTTVVQWFAQFDANPVLGLRNLDLLNVIITAIGLPMYVALYGAQRKTRGGLAMLALVLVTVGSTVFMANNVALPMLDLGRQYASASTESQRLVLEGAGAALLVRGEHGSLGALAGFLLPSIGTLIMAMAMLSGDVFKRSTGLIGMVGTGLLLVYVAGVPASLAPAGVLLGIAGIGGVLMMLWNVLVARVLWRLGATPEREMSIDGT